MNSVNEGKQLTIQTGEAVFERLPLKTKLITAEDDIVDVCREFALPYLQQGDILFISEKAVACSQGRAVPMAEIKPRRLAKFLTRFVYKSPYGIGLGIPETMEMALRECGVLRILFAAGISAVGKLLGKRGWFYKVAGYRAESIDGPTPNTIPPYNSCVVLGPLKPDETARRIADALGFACAIVDINDLNGKTLGASAGVDKELVAASLKDNPLGQSRQQTPMGILRRQ